MFLISKSLSWWLFLNSLQVSCEPSGVLLERTWLMQQTVGDVPTEPSGLLLTHNQPELCLLKIWFPLISVDLCGIKGLSILRTRVILFLFSPTSVDKAESWVLGYFDVWENLMRFMLFSASHWLCLLSMVMINIGRVFLLSSIWVVHFWVGGGRLKLGKSTFGN